VVWLVAAALIVVLVVLILVPGGDRRDREIRDLIDSQTDLEQTEQGDAAPEISPDDASGREQAEEQVPEPEEQQISNDAEEDRVPAPDDSKKYFVIAGSFSRLNNASELQDQLNSRGFQAEVMITDNRMYRVSVASFASKAEAQEALSRIKSEPGLESCWLLSN
jgi:cell division protein FtsN